MKILSIFQSNSIVPILFLGALTLILSISSFSGNKREAEIASVEMAFEIILSPEEELDLAREAVEAMEPEIKEVVILPQEIYIYDQDNNLIEHVRGTMDELQQNNQLQSIIANSNLLMEDGVDKFYIQRK
ncbi:hypothetical protein [Xanthovirga aplysinae]|uniref:hypothetical protein n=1 Tax=Xanthovirga aplysinae TaxID=2529853 RepID=UPI0012BB9CA1|nr:hypothetical protein [Xanthovirga aplysinae]MTI31400.1 hypothetical protein [Xanthovirga aplysinae]